MAISISGSSSQSQDAANNYSTVYCSGSMTLTVGSFSGLQSYGRCWIGGQNYDTAGPTSMSQGGSWGWSASRGYGHDYNSGYRGDVGCSVEHWVSGTSYHAGSAGAGTQGAIDYNRSANTPYYNNITRTSPTNIYASFARTGSVNGPTWYVLERSTSSDMSANYTTIGEGDTGVSATSNYYFRMYAYGTEGGNKYSGVYGPYYGVPSAPTSVVGTASTSVSGRITVSWTAPGTTNGGITNYYVYRDGTYIGQTGNATTSFIDDGRTKGTNYSYTVVAYNATGASSASAASTATQAPGSPYAATLSSAVASTDTFGKVTLSWTAPTTAVGTIQNYYMYAVYNSVIEKTVSTGTDVLTGDITGLDERKVYTFYVRARNQFSIDNSAPGDLSNTINRKSPGRPTAPTSLAGVTLYDPPGTANLSWTSPTDVGTETGTITGYNIYLAGVSTPVLTTTGTGTTATIADLIPATNYTFNVRARNELTDIVGIYSDASNAVTVTAKGEPNAPTDLVVVSDPIVAGRLILTWTPPVGYNTGFRVYTGAGALVANISTPRLEIDGLTVNTSYSYKVRARNPLTDISGSEGGPFSATAAGTVGSSSTQTVPSIGITNNTNTTFVGTQTIVSTTSTTVSYSKSASNIGYATVPTNGGTTVNNTNTTLNSTYTIAVPTSTSLTFTKEVHDIAANTSTPSGTITDHTNAVFNGSYTVLASPAPDPVAKTLSYTRVNSNISSRAASGLITNNSNAVFNGQYEIKDATETTIVYDRVSANIAESDAYGFVYDKTNSDIFNGTFALSDTPDHKTIEYSSGDLVYSENLITNPSFETVQSGSTILRTNLLTNPSFETNVTGWTAVSSVFARSSSFAKYGTHSGLVTPGSTTGGVSVTVATTSGQPYTFSCWLYAEEATSVNMVSGSYSTSKNIPADTWVNAVFSFNATASSSTVTITADGSTQPFYIDGALMEQTVYNMPYFDGSTVDALGWGYAWTGSANASTSTAKALSVGGNPVPASFTSTAALSYSAPQYRQFGSRSFYAVLTDGTSENISYTATTEVGKSYVFSAWFYPNYIPSRVILEANGQTSSETYLPQYTWTRVSVSFTATSTSTVLKAKGGTGGARFYTDDWMLEEGTTLSTYFDGSIDEQSTTWPAVYSWAGTEHASVSIREVGGTLPAIGSEILPPYGVAARIQSDAQLQIQYRSGWLG